MLRSSVRSIVSTSSGFASNTQLKLPLRFDDKTIFKNYSTWWLLRALLVLRICRIQYLSTNSVALMKKAEGIFGFFLTYKLIIKPTVYGHFCAGEDENELKHTLMRLEKEGVGSVLDYAAEADAEGFAPSPGTGESPDLSMASLVNNTSVVYSPNELMYDANMRHYVMCVTQALPNQFFKDAGVVAVKLTGMCDPQLLARVTAILHSVHFEWVQHFTGQCPPSLEECRVVMGVNKEHQLYITNDQLRKRFMSDGNTRKYTEEEVDAIIKALDEKNEGKVSYYRFKRVISEAILAFDPTPVKKLLAEKFPKLTEWESEMWCALNKRLSIIVHTARDLRVRVLVDAEQTFYQMAIDTIVLQLQRNFNIDEPVVYNTYQCYLTYTEDRIFNDLTRAEIEGWIWAGKVVRGAYMLQERQTALSYNYTSPVWPTYEETSKCYYACAERIFNEFIRFSDRPFEVLFGTHNKESVIKISESIAKLPPVKAKAVFAQLYGMSDQLTYALKNAGFCVFKYVPYGPVKETIHYLGRRALENSSILDSKDTEEVRLMKMELRRRLLWFKRS